MKYFADSIIKPYVIESGYRDLCEIGSRYGDHTDRLLEMDGVRVTIVDPCVDANLIAKYEGNERVEIIKGKSLDVLTRMERKFDSILLDGDHNWYTVYNELHIIHERDLLKKGGTIFLHDVGWPYGRRDLYYSPEDIPEQFRHPYAMKGIIFGQSELAESGGSNDTLYNATHEGGPKNGVLTAVEDFVREHKRRYAYVGVNEQHGLGILLKRRLIFGNKPFVELYLELNPPAQFERLRASIRYRLPTLYAPLSKLGNKMLGLL